MSWWIMFSPLWHSLDDIEVSINILNYFWKNSRRLFSKLIWSNRKHVRLKHLNVNNKIWILSQLTMSDTFVVGTSVLDFLLETWISFQVSVVSSSHLLLQYLTPHSAQNIKIESFLKNIHFISTLLIITTLLTTYLQHYQFYNFVKNCDALNWYAKVCRQNRYYYWLIILQSVVEYILYEWSICQNQTVDNQCIE